MRDRQYRLRLAMGEPPGDFMPPNRETLEDSTITFHGHGGLEAEAAPVDAVHILLLLSDNAPPKRMPLHSLPVVIGRAAPADLILEGNTVSRRHCKLEAEDGRVTLEDLGSTNGTYVNAARLNRPAVLEDGALIGIGAYRLRYHRRAQDETADADALDREWEEANSYIASILPKPMHQGPVRADWFYLPSTRVGGDAFGYQMIDRDHFAVFLLDVSGHGTGAAMHAMSIAHVMRERALPGVDFLRPAAVIAGLNAMFQMERYNHLFFTIWYGVYDSADRVLAYAAGGHHAAYLLAAEAPAGAASPLTTLNPIVGMLPDPLIAAAEVDVPVDATLHLFSDGVFEVVDRDGLQLGLDDILPMLPDAASSGPRLLYDRIRARARPGPLDDDFSALVLRFP